MALNLPSFTFTTNVNLEILSMDGVFWWSDLCVCSRNTFCKRAWLNKKKKHFINKKKLDNIQKWMKVSALNLHTLRVNLFDFLFFQNKITWRCIIRKPSPPPPQKKKKKKIKAKVLLYTIVSQNLYHFESAEVLIICPVKNELAYALYLGPGNQDKEISKMKIIPENENL